MSLLDRPFCSTPTAHTFSGLCFMVFVPCATTLATVPRSSRMVNVSIFMRVLVPLRAVGFRRLLRSATQPCLTALRVDAMIDWLKMFRIDTGRSTAKMVNIFILRDGANKQCVDKAMSPNQFGAVPKDTVAKGHVGCCPQPARFGLVDLDPESLFWSLRRACESTCLSIMFHPVIITEKR